MLAQRIHRIFSEGEAPEYIDLRFRVSVSARARARVRVRVRVRVMPGLDQG